MLSFELIALVLLLAAIILILLEFFILKTPKSKLSEETMHGKKEVSPKKSVKNRNLKKRRKESLDSKAQRSSLKCTKGFGYLRKLDEKALIPNECLTCPKMLECREPS